MAKSLYEQLLHHHRRRHQPDSSKHCWRACGSTQGLEDNPMKRTANLAIAFSDEQAMILALLKPSAVINLTSVRCAICLNRIPATAPKCGTIWCNSAGPAWRCPSNSAAQPWALVPPSHWWKVWGTQHAVYLRHYCRPSHTSRASSNNKPTGCQLWPRDHRHPSPSRQRRLGRHQHQLHIWSNRFRLQIGRNQTASQRRRVADFFWYWPSTNSSPYWCGWKPQHWQREPLRKKPWWMKPNAPPMVLPVSLSAPMRFLTTAPRRWRTYAW